MVVLPAYCLRSLCRGTVAGLAAFFAVHALHGEESPLHHLEALVSRKTELQLTLSEETRAWEIHKAALDREADLLSREKAMLTDQIQQVREGLTTADMERLQLQQELDRANAERDAITPLLSGAEKRLEQSVHRLPELHRKALDEAFSRLPHGDAERASRSPDERLQAITALYIDLADCHNRCLAGSSLLETDPGEKRLVKTVYLGLACGYAVTPDGTWAAVGRPEASGWQWEEAPGLAESILKAYEAIRSEHTASRVDLPLVIREESRP